MNRAALAGLAVLALLAGACGDDEDGGESASKTETAAKKEEPKRAASLADACTAAARDLKDPIAFERKLPKSPVPTTTTDPELKRRAAELRGTKEIMQRVYDAAGEQAEYQAALRDLIQELDDAELVARSEYNVEGTEGRLRTRWRRAQAAAPEECSSVRAPG
jgi:hypothetical protein